MICEAAKLKTKSLLWVLTFFAFSGCSIYHPKPLTTAAVESNLKVPSESLLRAEASQLKHPVLRPVEINLRDGISPDEAAVIAVLLNPTLRANRDRRGLATAQLIQAGVLPNPQISYGRDYVVGGDTAGTITAFGLSGSWDVTSLITLLPKIQAARADVRSVDLDIAWVEWQTAQAARTAVYRIIALEAELSAAREADRALRENVETLIKAVELREKTALDLAAAQSTSEDAHLTVLNIQQELAKQHLALNRAMGLPMDAKVRVQRMSLPSSLGSPPETELIAGLESRRLDLLGLKQGYESQDTRLRAAILAQFPRISLGFNRAGDTSNVQTLGFGVTADVPIFDRNQGNIATERATRQKLFDEYADRLFQARSDVGSAISDIRHLNRQIAAGEKLIPTLQRLVDTARSALDQGNADTISYYQTRFNLITRQIEVLKLKQQLTETHVALEIASGRYLPDPETP
jgi:outer membrane protein TolC